MKKEVIAHKDPKSPISEIFRSLRTNIQFMSSSKGLKTILVTSTLQNEGKSWITANLAVTFAQAGKKVIIVDSDMRKGRQYNIFSVEPMPGLSNYLSGIDENGEDGDDNILSYIKETEVDNLYIIPAGNVPPNPSELLVSDKMLKMINRLKELSDIIIFDGTPSILVTDAVILSRVVDTTIIVTTHKETKIENLQKVKRAIENVGGNIAGVIINRMPMSMKKYEDRYYYGSNKLKKSQIASIEYAKNTIKDNEIEIAEEELALVGALKSTIKKNSMEETIKDRSKVEEKNIKIEKGLEKKEINEKRENPELIENDEISEEEKNIKTPEIGIVNTEDINVENAEEILNQMKEYLAYEKSQLKKGENND